MVCVLKNKVDRWYIFLETKLFGKLWRSRLSEDEVADIFFAKIERRKCKNTQNILFDGCHLLFEEKLNKIMNNDNNNNNNNKDLHAGICTNPQKGSQCMNRMIDLSD